MLTKNQRHCRGDERKSVDPLISEEEWDKLILLHWDKKMSEGVSQPVVCCDSCTEDCETAGVCETCDDA